MFTIIADSNIAHLNDYFNDEILGIPVQVISITGRDITADIIKEHQPKALLIRSVTKVDAHLLDSNESVAFVGSATIGIDHVDAEYLVLRGIRFANASGCSKHSVAQYVMTAILRLRPDYWDTSIKLGIIGLGNIGSTLAQYALSLGWQVLGYDPYLGSSAINNASFDEVLTQSQVMSLHVPLSTHDQSLMPTKHLIDAQALAMTARDTILINTARGPVINESDLLEDLVHQQRPVVLDVFEHEPIVSAPLLQRLAIATPHIAGYTLEGKLRGTQMVFDAFVNVFADLLAVNDPKLMDRLLPSNPYEWLDLKDDPTKLASFYDIKSDDKLIRNVMDRDKQQVSGLAFDTLRKQYKLRREWIFRG